MLCTLDSDSPCRSESIKRLRIGVLPAAAGKRATTVWLRKSDRLIAQYAPVYVKDPQIVKKRR